MQASKHHKSEPEITTKSTKSEGSGMTNAYHLELINLLNIDHVLSDESLKGLARSYQKFLSKAMYNFSDLKTWIKNGGTLDLDVKKELEEEKKGQKKNEPKKAKAVEAEDVEMEEVEGRKGKGKQKEKGKGKEQEQHCKGNCRLNLINFSRRS